MSFFKKNKSVFFKAAVITTALLLYCSAFSSCGGTSSLSDVGQSENSPVTQTAYLPSGVPIPSVSARSAILIDADSGATLCSKDPDKRMPMASTTKIMTALVAIENGEPEKKVNVSPLAVGVEGSSVYLYEGEHLTVEDLLYATLLESANDAATAIAVEIGGSVEDFADMMNQKAAELGLKDTHFTNPHGLDDPEHYTTARELAIIAAAAMKNDKFREIVSTHKKTIPLNGTEGVRLLINHNKLLKSYDGAIGVKTGYTKKSGRCLVSAAERDGLNLICVTLSAPDDWRDHKALLDYGFSAYESRLLAADGELAHILPVVGSDKEYVTLTNLGEIRATLPRSAPMAECRIETTRFEYAPISEGEVLGRVIYTVGGKTIASAPLYASYSAESVKYKISLWERITSLFKK